MIELHWATPEHADAILDLMEEYHRQEGLRGHSRQRLRAVLEGLFEHRHRGRVVVARDDGEVLGYALVVRRPSFEWASDLAQLDEIFIRGKARDRGLGRRMITFVEEYAATEGLPAISLEVASQNVAAVGFYRAVGFSRVDREIFARPVAGPR
jgi:ribosomal protein S18 acetylase RimI-like enzyme